MLIGDLVTNNARRNPAGEALIFEDRRVTWSQLNSEKFDIEADAPSYRSILPHIIPIITSYKENNETKKS